MTFIKLKNKKDGSIIEIIGFNVDSKGGVLVKYKNDNMPIIFEVE